MANREDWSLTVSGDIDPILRELMKLPGVGEEQARKMAAAIEDEVSKGAKGASDAVDKMSRDAQKSLRKLEDQADDTGASVGDVGKNAGDTAGGIGKMRGAIERLSPELAGALELVEDVADSVEGGAELWEQYGEVLGSGAGLTGTAGAAAGAIAGLSVVVAAATTAAAVFLNQTQDVRMELRAYKDTVRDLAAEQRILLASNNALRVSMEGLEGFSGNLAIQTALLTGELDELDLVAGELGNALAAEMQPQIHAAGVASAEATQRVADLEEAILSGTLATKDRIAAEQELVEALAAEEQASENLRLIKEEYAQTREEIGPYIELLREQRDESQRTATGVQTLRTETEAAAESTAHLVAETRAVLNAQRAWQEAAQRAELGAPYYELEQQLLAIEGAVMDGAITERQAVMLRLEAEAEYSDFLAKQVKERDQLRQQAHDAELARIAAEKQAQMDSAQQALAITQQGFETAQTLSDAYFSARLQGMEQDTAAAADLARRQFRVNQALNVGMAIVNGAQAKLMAAATLGPPVPPNIVGIIGQAMVDAQVAASIAAIAAAPPPKFHLGGLITQSAGRAASTPQPTETPITARQGEYVLTETQVRNFGGAEALDRTRAGGGGGPGPIVVEYRRRNRVLDTDVYEVMQAGGATGRATRALRTAESVNPYRSGV